MVEQLEANTGMVGDVFADMGFDGVGDDVKEACRDFALKHLQECPGLAVDELQCGLWYFREGYVEALDRFGKYREGYLQALEDVGTYRHMVLEAIEGFDKFRERMVLAPALGK